MLISELRSLLAAAVYAAAAHGHQERKANGKPYITHPLEVARRASLMLDEQLDGSALEQALIAALLHDVAEDTKVTLKDIERDWGPYVVKIVDELTNDKSLNHDARFQKMAAKAKTFSLPARIIKLADRHHNLESSEEMPIEFIERYCRESRLLLVSLTSEPAGRSFGVFVKQCYTMIEALEKKVDKESLKKQ